METYNGRFRFHFDNMYKNEPKIFGSVVVHQIGDLSCEAGYDTIEHRQYCHEITYVISGKGTCYTNGVPTKLKSGDLFISLYDDIHNIIADNSDPLRYLYLGFTILDEAKSPNPLDYAVDYFEKLDKRICKCNYDMYSCFLEIFNEIIKPRTFSELLIETNLIRILTFACRSFEGEPSVQYQPRSKGDANNQLVYDIVHYIDSNIIEITDLVQIAAHFGYNYSYLSHLFSVVMGQSIKNYLTCRRFSKAAHLMESTDLNITEISDMLKYTSIHSFSRAFKKYFGVAPYDYRLNKKGIQVNQLDYKENN